MDVASVTAGAAAAPVVRAPTPTDRPPAAPAIPPPQPTPAAAATPSPSPVTGFSQAMDAVMQSNVLALAANVPALAIVLQQLQISRAVEPIGTSLDFHL